MAVISPPPPVPTDQLAQHIPSYDPGPVIAAQEQSLQDYLNLPVREILERLGLPPVGAEKPAEGLPPPEGQPETAAPQNNPMDPSALISPVTDALSTLGPGLFEGVDPMTMLQGLSQAFQSTGGSLQQSLGAVDDSWQGASGTAATAKTTAAIADGAEVGTQSDALRGSLATAAADVAQARARMIEIITEFQATIAAIGPSIIFPWGWAAAIAAANKAIAMTAEAMTEVQGSLGAEAAQVTAAGAPVDIAAAPTLGASPFASLLPSLMSMATKGAQAGLQAGTKAASAANQTASETASKTTDPASSGGGGTVPLSAGAGGGSGGGAGSTLASRSIPTSQMLQPQTTSAPTQSATVRPFGTGGPGMMGAPFAPMAGAGQGANSSSSTHTSAAFLHTTDQGGEIVGDLGTAAPPVLGEADPDEPPDVQLRI